LRFKSYLIENKKNFQRGKHTVLDPFSADVQYGIAEVMKDTLGLKKGFYRIYGKSSGGQKIVMGKGPAFKLTQIKGYNTKVRSEGKSFQIEMTKEDLQSGDIIREVSVFNNVDALEHCPIIAGEYYLEHQTNIPIDEMCQAVDNFYRTKKSFRITQGFNYRIYKNAISTLSELKKIMKKGTTYSFERQGDNHSKVLYTLAKKYNKYSGDHWNPADIWLFSAEGVSAVNNIDSFIENYVESLQIKNTFFESKAVDNEKALALNYFISQGMQSKNIVPVSLKSPLNPGNLNVYTLNNFNPAHLPKITNMGNLKVTDFSVGSTTFGSLQISSNHPRDLKLKFQRAGGKGSEDFSINFQHNVWVNGTGEGSYLDTKEWRDYLKNNNIQMYGSGGTYKTIPSAKGALKKLFDHYYNVMKNNKRWNSKVFDKMGDKDAWFEEHFNDNETNNKTYIQRMIFLGSWHEAVINHGDDMVKKAIAIATKADHSTAGPGPHYIIK